MSRSPVEPERALEGTPESSLAPSSRPEIETVLRPPQRVSVPGSELLPAGDPVAEEAASRPDIGLRLLPCLDTLDARTGTDTRQVALGFLRTALAGLQQQQPAVFQQPQVLLECSQNHEIGGIWFDASSDPAALAAAIEAVPWQQIPVIELGLVYQIQFYPDTIRALLDANFPSERTDSQPGQGTTTIQFSGHSLAFPGNDQIVLTAQGSASNTDQLYGAPFGFTATYTETVGAANGSVTSTVTPSLQLDAGAELAGAALGNIFPVNIVVFDQIEEGLAGQTAPEIGGIGAQLAALLPRQVLLPRSGQGPAQKLVFEVADGAVSVDSDQGLLIAGQIKQVDRQPAVWLHQPEGPAYLSGSTVVGDRTQDVEVAWINAGVQDLRWDATHPLQATWTAANGTITPSSDHPLRASISVTIPESTVQNLPSDKSTTVTDTVTVTVTDADGVQASAQLLIQIEIYGEGDPPGPNKLPADDPDGGRTF